MGAGFQTSCAAESPAQATTPVHSTTRSIILRNFQIFSLPVQFTLFSAPSAPQNQVNMSKIFNWEYFSFVTLDDAVAYKVGGDVN